MESSPTHARVCLVEKEPAMNAMYTVIVVVFVLSVLAVAAYALFEMSPFAHHAER
jgi:hypothetical protein